MAGGMSDSPPVQVDDQATSESAARPLAKRTLGGMPWWLWVDVLCVVAPIAALAWHWLFARSTNVKLHPATHPTLALAVWIIAVSDRLLEARRRRLTWRHWFVWRFRYPFFVLLAGALAVCFWLSFYALPQVILELGGILAIGVILYLFFARIQPGSKLAVPRDLVRGALFTVGAMIAVWGTSNVPRGAVWLIAGQTVLVSLVFLGSSCMEHLTHESDERERADWLAIDSRIGVWTGVLLGSLVWLVSHEMRQGASMAHYYLAMILSGSLFFAAHAMRQRMASDTFHVLAWITLTAPLLVLGFLKFEHKNETAVAPIRTFDDDRTAHFENSVRFEDRFVEAPKL